MATGTRRGRCRGYPQGVLGTRARHAVLYGGSHGGVGLPADHGAHRRPGTALPAAVAYRRAVPVLRPDHGDRRARARSLDHGRGDQSARVPGRRPGRGHGSGDGRADCGARGRAAPVVGGRAPPGALGRFRGGGAELGFPAPPLRVRVMPRYPLRSEIQVSANRKAVPMSYDNPPGGYGGPPGGQGNPPGGYGGPPGGYGNPPGGYGNPPGGYGPPGDYGNPPGGYRNPPRGDRPPP